MSNKNSATYIFKQIIAVFLLLVAFVLCLETMFKHMAISATPGGNSFVAFFFGIVLCLLLFLLICVSFYVIERIKTDRRQYYLAAGIFLFILGLLTVVICSMDVRPMTDSFDDIETAYYLLTHSTVTSDNARLYLNNIGQWKNNYCFIMTLEGLFRLMKPLGVKNILPVLYSLDIAAILLCHGIGWLIIRECFSAKKANKYLVLSALNPVYYGLVFWSYTLIYSLPIAMLILYIPVRYSRSRSLWKKVALAAAEGILVAFGFEFRATAVFPFVAVALVLLVSSLRPSQIPRKSRSTVLAIALFLAAAFSTGSVIHHLEDIRFQELYGQNVPVSYWLMMGSHGSGGISTNDEDEIFVQSVIDQPDKGKQCLEKAIDNYRAKTLPELLRFWENKIIITWCEGYSGIALRLRTGLHEGAVYDLLAGKWVSLFQIYCVVFRVVLYFGLALFGGYLLTSDEIRIITIVLPVTILGAFLFYLFWEAKSVYSAAFLPFIVICAMLGIDSFTPFHLSDRKSAKTLVYCVIPAAVIVLAFAVMIYPDLIRTVERNEIRINALGDIRLTKPIPGDNIVQDFYTKSKFNQIVLYATKNSGRSSAEYEVTICDSNNQVLVQQQIDGNRISSDRIVLEFDTIESDAHYYLKIHRMSGEEGSIAFYTKNNYYLDSYPGSLVTAGESIYVNDLLLNVRYHSEGPFLSKSQTIGVISGYCILAALILGGAVSITNKQKELYG